MIRLLILLPLSIAFLGLAQAQEALNERVSIEIEAATLEEAIYILTDQEGIKLTFGNHILPEYKINLSFQDAPLNEVLDVLLEKSNLKYQLVGDQIVLYPKPDLQYTVSGFLKDAESGEPLIYANIIDLNSSKGSSTNAYGFFSFSIPKGRAKIAFSYTGYTTYIKEVEIDKDTQVDISIAPSLTLEPIEIIGLRNKEATMIGLNQAAIPLREVESLPALAGENDIIRTIQLLPGIQTGTDGVGGLHVRGGGNGQNLIMIDGVPVYNISHAAGIFSILNTNAVSSATLYKGNFPARFGGRLSSVLDVRTKEGSTKKWGFRGEIGTLAGRLTADGPIVKDKSSFFFSGRMSLVDWYLEPITRNLKAEKGEEGFIGYRFYDFNAKINYEFSRKDKLYLSLYSGADDYSNEGSASDILRVEDQQNGVVEYANFERSYSDFVNWGNTVASLRWNHLFNNQLFANLAATYTRFDVNIDYGSSASIINSDNANYDLREFDRGYYESNISDIGLKLDVDYRPGSGHYIRFGAQLIHHTFRPGALSYTQDSKIGGDIPILQDTRIRAMEYSGYIEDEFQLNDKIIINAGLHAALFQVRKKWYGSLQPRISIDYSASDKWSFNTYFNRSTQYIHLLSNSILGLPTELWVPATEEIAPQQIWQTGVGANWAFASNWLIGAEAYYKSMNHLLSYSEGALFVSDWEQNVTSGEGVAYGLEFLLQKQFGSTRLWASYGIMQADRRFNLVNQGVRFPYRYDQRHQTKLAAVHKFGKWLELSASWVINSGTAFSFPKAEYNITLPNGDVISAQDFSSTNEFRLPYYHRLDFSVNIFLDMERSQHVIKMGVYNLYNRANPLFYDIRTTNYEWVNGEWLRQRELVEATLIPLLPSFNYSLKF
jgi:hypothetical protein